MHCIPPTCTCDIHIDKYIHVHHGTAKTGTNTISQVSLVHSACTTLFNHSKITHSNSKLLYNYCNFIMLIHQRILYYHHDSGMRHKINTSRFPAVHRHICWEQSPLFIIHYCTVPVILGIKLHMALWKHHHLVQYLHLFCSVCAQMIRARPCVLCYMREIRRSC